MGRWALDDDKERPTLQVRRNFVLELLAILVPYIILQLFFILLLYGVPLFFLDFLAVLAPVSAILVGLLRDRAYRKTIYRILGKKVLGLEILLEICYIIIVFYLSISYVRLEYALDLFLKNPLHIILYVLSIAVLVLHCYVIYYEFRKLRENPNQY
jgi:hypothetical protein